MRSSMRHLVGPIKSVLAETIIQIPERPIAQGSSETRAVEVDDITRAFVRFDHGSEALALRGFRRLRQLFLRHFDA